MKAISLFKLLTLVSFFVVGLASTQSYAGTVTKSDVDDETDCSSYDNKTDCETWKANYIKKQSRDDKKDKDAICKQALSAYDDAMKKTDEECSRMDIKNTQECREKAKSCAKGLDSSGDSDSDSDSATASIVKMIGIYGQMQANAAGVPNSLNGCTIDNDDKGKSEEERIDDKITRLREEIQDLKEKATAADKEFNDKKNDVETQMNDVEKDADKAKFDKQTKNQEDAGRMQKAIMASEKKKKDNLIIIQDKQVQIANIAFAQQKINLALADEKITKDCRDLAQASVAAKLKGTVDPKTGKVSKPSFTRQQSAQFKKDLRLEESNCLQEKAIQKQETIKSILDSKRKLESDIKTKMSENEDESKAIENEMKQMEALKKISDDEEKKAIDSKLKKLNTLNTSVTAMEQHVTDKKKSYDEKAKAKNDQISKLLIDRQNVKAKFVKVSVAASASKRAAETYINQCCTDSDASKNDKNCSRVLTAEPDSKPKKAKTTTTGSKK